MANLWLHQGVYPDWIADEVRTLRACEMYACRPSELDGEDWHTVELHRTIKAAEADYARRDAEGRAALRK